jgi:hypothetical protein
MESCEIKQIAVAVKRGYGLTRAVQEVLESLEIDAETDRVMIQGDKFNVTIDRKPRVPGNLSTIRSPESTAK